MTEPPAQTQPPTQPPPQPRSIPGLLVICLAGGLAIACAVGRYSLYVPSSDRPVVIFGIALAALTALLSLLLARWVLGHAAPDALASPTVRRILTVGVVVLAIVTAGVRLFWEAKTYQSIRQASITDISQVNAVALAKADSPLDLALDTLVARMANIPQMPRWSKLTLAGVELVLSMLVAWLVAHFLLRPADR